MNKSKLSQILKALMMKRVAQSTTNLIPGAVSTHQNAKNAVEAMKNFKKIQGVSDDDLAKWIAEGRR